MSTALSNQPDDLTATERAQIDASTSGAVLLFFGSAAFWLVIGSFLDLLGSIQLIFPGFLDGLSFLTYGRVVQTASTVLAYGFATPAAIGIAIWLTARLCKAPLNHHSVLVSAGIVWNLGILVGACSIIAGNSTSFALLALPAFATPILFVSYALIAIWVLFTFNERKSGGLFVSGWFVFTAILAFPWLFGTANALLVWSPVAAPAQAPIALWFASGFLNLWLVPIGVAVAFYIIPKTTGLPIASNNLSLLGFWTLLLFGAWASGAQIIGGPVPAWITSAGVAASVMLMVPALAIGVNLHLTFQGRYAPVGWSPALRFVVVGMSSLMTYWVLSAINSLPFVNSMTQFSDTNRALYQLAHFGFFAMTAFGAIYYIVPRLTGKEWPCAPLILFHFWLAAVGFGLVVSGLLLGGLIQGSALNQTIVTFRSSMEFAWPFRFQAMTGSLLILASSVSFAMHFIGILLETRKNQAPAMLADREENSQEAVAV